MRLALLLVAACGSNPGGSADAASDGSGSAGDAAIDVPDVRGSVAVHVTNTAAGMCMPGLHAIFIDTDGTATDVSTDGNGDAAHEVFPGASVTVICTRTPPSMAITTVTIQAVEPGDNLVLDASAFFTGAQAQDMSAAGTFKVSFGAYAGAAGYTIYHPCGPTQATGTANQTLAMQAGCVQTSMDLVVVANNGMGNPIAFTSASGVAFANNGSLTISDAWHTFSVVTASYTNAPAFCADTMNMNYPCNVELGRVLPDLRGLLVRNNMNLTASASVPVTTATSAHAIMRTLFTTAGAVQQDVTQVVDGAQAAYALDLGATQLPWMCLDATANCPMWTKTDPKQIGVPVTGTGSFDLFEVDATYVRGQQIFVWRVFGPTAGDFVFPTLPASAPPVTPIAGDTKSATHAQICESDAIAGYRPARQNVFDALATCAAAPSPTAKHVPGTINRLSRVN